MKLTARQHQVLLLLVKGYNTQQIADKLFISISTVKVHRAGIRYGLEADEDKTGERAYSIVRNALINKIITVEDIIND